MNMINNLFSIFDPSSSYGAYSWLMGIIPLIILTIRTLKSKNKKIAGLNLLGNSIEKEYKQLTKESETKSLYRFMIRIFFLVIIRNIIAIMPFNFTNTAHISITFSLRIRLWVAIIVNALVNSFGNTMAHLTPIGTPRALINFMVIIEMTSQIIRPITLAVRLMANIVAGHLLLNLLRNFSLTRKTITISASLPIFTLVLLERGVALIQAYVITVLATLYYKETF